MQEAKVTQKAGESVFDWVQIISCALVLITCLFTFVGRFVDVHGSSMEHTLVNGERLILSSLPYTPDYGDIVVVCRDAGEEPLIKRVIGLAGDTIRIDEKTGTVYRNEVALSEPYTAGPTAPEQMTGPITVPQGMVFIAGDNRLAGHSLDSRTFGPVSETAVVGKVVFRVSPFENWGGLYA